MTQTLPLFKAVAAALDWRERATSANAARFSGYINEVMRGNMPSGAGFDNGVVLDLVRSTPEKLVFQFSYHHMDANGHYDGWTHHKAWVRPSFLFEGFTLRVDGPDRDDFRDYAEEMLAGCLTSVVESISHWLARTGHFNEEKA